MKPAYAVSTAFVLLMGAAIIYLGYESGNLGAKQINPSGHSVSLEPTNQAAAR